MKDDSVSPNELLDALNSKNYKMYAHRLTQISHTRHKANNLRTSSPENVALR
jgi:hypothetical protein